MTEYEKLSLLLLVQIADGIGGLMHNHQPSGELYELWNEQMAAIREQVTKATAKRF